ncbi:MAG: MSCRAMM family protein [Caldilineaceae bacterium]
MVRVPLIRRVYFFLLLFLLLMSWLTLPTPRLAQAASGSISGVVTDEGGAPLGAIRVMAYRWVGDPAVETPHRVLEQTAMTLTDGSYTLAVPAADYYLRFVDTVVPVRYADKFYGDVFDISDASAVIVNDGAAVTGIQVQLALAGTISGQVQDPTGNPAVGVEVRAYRPVDNGTGEVTAELRGKTEVKADGSYVLALAYTGNIRLSLRDPAGVYQAELYNNLFDDQYPFQDKFPLAQDVPVTVGAQTTGINAVLDKLGRFTGSVTDRNGQPLAGITASAHRRYINGSGSTEWPSLGETKSGADGRYDFSVWLPGEYRICFNQGQNFTDYAPTCYGNAAVTGATDVAVNRNQSTTVPPVQLGKYGQISGRVTNEAGEPIAGAEIYVYNAYSGFIFLWADQNGYYRFPRQIPGSYRLSATYVSAGPYYSEFYNNVATFAEATDVEVALDEVVNIDFVLRAKKQVSGKVTDEAGNPLANVPVTVMQQRESGWHSVTQAVTDSNGRYALDGLAPGSYYIRFTSPLYEWEYYNNAATAEQATPIVVQAGASLTGLDAKLKRDKGTINIVVDSIPDSRQNFRFAGDLGKFRLDDITPDDSDAFGNTATFVVDAGPYTVEEIIPQGWYVANIACTNGDAWDWQTPRVTLNLAGQTNVTCTFRNERVGSIYTNVYHDLNGSGRRNQNEPWLAQESVAIYDDGYTLLTTLQTNESGPVGAPNLRAGEYTVCQRPADGWRNSQPGTIHPMIDLPCYTITVQPGKRTYVWFGMLAADNPAYDSDSSSADDGVEIVDEPDIVDDEAGYAEAESIQVFLPLLQR